MPAASRTVLIAGGTGLVGREILAGLMADPSVSAVHAFGRRAPAGGSGDKLQFHAVDFASLPTLPAASEAYVALGTTIKVAGSQAAFRAIDHDAVVNFAKAARAVGVAKLGVVSAMGADPRSSIFYSRTKGEAEEALRQVGFEGLVIARPSMLAGDRESLGQPVRGGEVLALKFSKLFAPLIPANYASVQASSVARALLAEVPKQRGIRVMPSGELRKY